MQETNKDRVEKAKTESRFTCSAFDCKHNAWPKCKGPYKEKVLGLGKGGICKGYKVDEKFIDTTRGMEG